MGINGSVLTNHLRAGVAANLVSNTNTNTPTTTKPVANYWLNIGYTIEVDVDSDSGPKTETRFISLQSGIALDTLPDLDTKGGDGFRKMQAARNDLRDQLIETARDMIPGEERILGTMDCGLQLQLRRVNDAKAAIKSTENPFSKRLSFAA
jgi:hypothetical protein